MNNVLEKVDELKEEILSSDTYLNYKKYSDKIDDNKDIKKIIFKIKGLQKILVNKEEKNINRDKEEFELDELFRKLNSFEEYENYIKYAKELNKLISSIQKRFEDYFNEFVL